MIRLSNDIATGKKRTTNTDRNITLSLQVVLPSRATSAKTVQQRKGRGTEQENSVQREREKKRKRLINITLHTHAAKKERENSLELCLYSMCKSIYF